MARSPSKVPIPDVPKHRAEAFQVARELLCVIESWAWSNAEHPDQATTESGEAFAGIGRLTNLIGQYLDVAQSQ